LLAETAQGWIRKEAGSPPIPIVMEATQAISKAPHPSSSQLK
jgi:hypothetical protein